MNGDKRQYLPPATTPLRQDLTAIIANPDLVHLWPPWRAGQSSLRVLLFYTLALNRAVGGLQLVGQIGVAALQAGPYEGWRQAVDVGGNPGFHGRNRIAFWLSFRLLHCICSIRIPRTRRGVGVARRFQ